MKKLLAFALAAVMLLSAVPFAGAASFTDSEKVSFMTSEAVDIMSDLKIITGFPEGTFKPEDTLTRAQAAKILCCVALGTQEAEALAGGGKTFSDVPADHWANKYVEYCASKGIVAGVGNGKFNPNGELTGYAFGKMLLVALGADASELTGASWDKNTKAQLVEKHLDYGVSPSNNKLSRQDACRLALNAMFFGEGDDPEDTLAYKNFGVMRAAAGFNSKAHRRPFTNYISSEEDAYWTGAEKKITASPAWFSKTGAVKGGDIVKALGVSDISIDQFRIFRNGIEGTKDEAKNYLHEGNTKPFLYSGDGVRLEFYYAADTGMWTIVYLFYYPAKVKAVVEATYYSDGTVETPGAVVFENGWNCASNDFKQSDVGNYACCYVDGDKSMNVPKAATEAIPGTVVEGVLTSYDKNGVTIGGKAYKFASYLGTAAEAKHYLDNGGELGDTVKAVLSDDGFVIMVWK